MGVEEVPPELIEKAKACNTPEELAALAKESGFELSDEELKGIAGGTPHLGGTPPCTTKILDKPGNKFKKSSYLKNQQTQPESAGQ